MTLIITDKKLNWSFDKILFLLKIEEKRPKDKDNYANEDDHKKDDLKNYT